MKVKSTGYTLTGSYVPVLAGGPTNYNAEFINNSANEILLLIGDQPLDDSNAIPVAAGDSWYPLIPLNVPVHAKGTGRLVVIAGSSL